MGVFPISSAEKGSKSRALDSHLARQCLYAPVGKRVLFDKLAGILPPVSLGKYQQDVSGESSESVERYILNLNWRFLGHTLNTISSWEDNTRYHRQDRDETAAPGNVVRVTPFIAATTTENTGLSEIETHEIQLASDHEGSLTYLLGYYYQHVDSVSITSIDPIFSGTTPIVTDSSAYFGNATYSFNDRWSASVGVRYDEDERTGSNTAVGNNHVETFRETTYSAKVVYQPDSDRMFYFTHDKGFKSGGVNREFSTCGQGLCLGADQATWDPETAYNYELGMKTEWLDNRLRVNAALFFTIFEDFQVAQYVSEAVSLVVSNAAEVEAKGIEIDFTGVINDHFKLNGSVTYVQSEYSDYQGAPCAELDLSGCIDGTQDLSGKTLDHAPKLSFNLGAEYRNSLARVNGVEWFARADLIYKGKQNLYVLLPKSTEESAYSVLNARFGLESYDNWRLTFWGKNITNEGYRSAALSSGLGGLSEIPGLPRTYGVTVDWYL